MFALKIISSATLAGLLLGSLAAGMVPTTMREAPPEWWRGMLESRKSPEPITYRFVEAGPQDLDPHGVPQPEIRTLAPRFAQRAAHPQPAYLPSGFEGFEIEPPEALPVTEEVRLLREKMNVPTALRPVPVYAKTDKFFVTF